MRSEGESDYRRGKKREKGSDKRERMMWRMSGVESKRRGGQYIGGKRRNEGEKEMGINF